MTPPRRVHRLEGVDRNQPTQDAGSTSRWTTPFPCEGVVTRIGDEVLQFLGAAQGPSRPSGEGSRGSLPPVHGLTMHRLWTQFGELDSDPVRVGDVVQDGLGVAVPNLAHVRAPTLEHRGGGGHVLDVDAAMVDRRWTSGTRLQLEERVLAHLDVHQPGLALVVVDAKTLRKARR